MILIGSLKNNINKLTETVVIRYFLQFNTFRQLVKYGIVGVGAATIDFGIYYLLTRTSDFWGHNYLLANIIAFGGANLFSFTWQKKWTFRVNFGKFHLLYGKYLMVTLTTLGLSELVLYTVVEHLILSDLIGKLLAVALAAVMSFLANKFWTFRII